MNTETSISLGIVVRVFVNLLCSENIKLAAALLGLWDGLLIHRSWVERRLFEPDTILLLAAGFLFDHVIFASVVRTVTLLLGCGLGIVLSDIGPDIWYEIGGDRIIKDVNRGAESVLAAIPFLGVESSDEDDASVSSRSSFKPSTRRSTRSSTTVTVRPRRRVAPSRTDQSTRLSRVTFDESSISQSQASESSDDEADNEDANGSMGPSQTEPEMYMEPSVTAGSQYTRIRDPSILRRLNIPGGIPAPSSSRSSISQSHTVGDGERTPRAQTFEFSPLPPSAMVPPPPLIFSNHLDSHPYSQRSSTYAPIPIPEPSLHGSSSQPLPVPSYPVPVDHGNGFPFSPDGSQLGHRYEQGHDIVSQISEVLNVPIASHQGGSPGRSRSPSPSRPKPPSQSPRFVPTESVEEIHFPVPESINSLCLFKK